MKKRNLILSIVHNYDYPVVEPFVKSLRESGYKDDLVVFASETTKRATKRLLRKYGVVLIEFKTAYPFIDDYQDVFKDISPAITVNNYRFLLFLKFLETHAGTYNNVMLTDIRDVVFQQNIFDKICDNQIYFFLEDSSEIFRTSELNRRWFLHANGQELTTKLIDKNVSCAGITLGSEKLIFDYLEYFRERFKFRQDLEWGVDQGLHNAYIYTIPNSSAVIVPNTADLILTLGACKSFNVDENSNLVNESKALYAVVHQWDRFGDLIVYFKRKYIGSRVVQVFKKIIFAILP